MAKGMFTDGKRKEEQKLLDYLQIQEYKKTEALVVLGTHKGLVVKILHYGTEIPYHWLDQQITKPWLAQNTPKEGLRQLPLFAENEFGEEYGVIIHTNPQFFSGIDARFRSEDYETEEQFAFYCNQIGTFVYDGSPQAKERRDKAMRLQNEAKKQLYDKRMEAILGKRKS